MEWMTYANCFTPCGFLLISPLNNPIEDVDRVLLTYDL